jgi:hypothetical protein
MRINFKHEKVRETNIETFRISKRMKKQLGMEEIE